MRPDVITRRARYFNNVQTKNRKYTPLIRAAGPAGDRAEHGIMEVQPALQKYYYDPTKYKTYLEQLGIEYPMVRTGLSTAPGAK